ncbi:MAG TPA: Gfo/Idh/MocA family oxidoreductase [Bacteroidales bacterium]|nr:Gfo/Idh/MocA family oxidoreductase [Bacteroidales bacterium]
MKNFIRRREFIKTTAAGGIGLGLTSRLFPKSGENDTQSGRVGIIGLDTSHSTAFTKALNDPDSGPEFGGFKIVAAYPRGSNDIKSSVDRIPAYTEQVMKLGVEIVNSIDELLGKVDFVLLETNDGRLHLEQALQVMKAGKSMFIDKPIAASLSDTIAIFKAASHYNVPLFSSSSLRYITGVKEIAEGSIGKVTGAYTYSPATLELTHPDLFWYGVHGVEILFTVMGTGCKNVVRSYSDNTDVVTAIWQDDRIGTYRGIRSGKSDYGGIVYGEKGISVLGKYSGYNPLLNEIIKFFQTGTPPVTAEETTEIFAFMEAADKSKQRGGSIVEIEEVMKKATKEANQIISKII